MPRSPGREEPCGRPTPPPTGSTPRCGPPTRAPAPRWPGASAPGPSMSTRATCGGVGLRPPPWAGWAPLGARPPPWPSQASQMPQSQTIAVQRLMPLSRRRRASARTRWAAALTAWLRLAGTCQAGPVTAAPSSSTTRVRATYPQPAERQRTGAHARGRLRHVERCHKYGREWARWYVRRAVRQSYPPLFVVLLCGLIGLEPVHHLDTRGSGPIFSSGWGGTPVHLIIMYGVPTLTGSMRWDASRIAAQSGLGSASSAPA